jgi:hypothetical protein
MNPFSYNFGLKFEIDTTVTKSFILLSMKKIFLLSVFAFMLVVNAFSQQAVADTTLTIQFDALVHDYGTIVKGSDGSCEFVFKNMGQTPLILNNVAASCGCTVPQWTREPVQPGKSGSIKVSYNTQIVSTFAKSITVISNAKNSPVILTIKGTVTEPPAAVTK